MSIKKYKDAIMLLIAVLWLVCMYLGWNNHYVLGMSLGVVLMLLHMIMGVANEDVVSKKFLIFPLIPWAILWIASFVLSEHFAVIFKGKMPDFTVLGFHPSFASTVFLYWIGGMLTLTLGLFYLQKEWLSDEKWNNFLNKIKEIDGSEE